MIIKQFVSGQLENNTYLILDEQSKKGVIIDATTLLPDLIDSANGYDIEYILLTHGHFDHIGGVKKLQELGAKVYIHKNDVWKIDSPGTMAKMLK